MRRCFIASRTRSRRRRFSRCATSERGRFTPALDLLKKEAIDVESLISEDHALSKGVHAMQRAGVKGVLKVLLRP